MGLIDFEDNYPWNPGPGALGAAHSVSSDSEPENVLEQMLQVVEEVTGEPIERKQTNIGFY